MVKLNWKTAIIFLTGVLMYFGNAFAELKAFPTAEGYGRLAKGGRGGSVIEVTNLNRSGPGSFGAAIAAKGPRTVVFRVSGYIQGGFTVKNPYLTIAGQTAPGKGICIKHGTFAVSSQHVVVRFIRSRLGSGKGGDGFSSPGCENVIWDHCSVSWTNDEAFSAHPTGNITVQRTLIAEALNPRHHGFAASVLGNIGSYHHNLLANNFGRNVSMAGKNNGGKCWGKMDIRNNVVYNWGIRTTDGEINLVNFVNNYFKPGPASTLYVGMRCTFTTFCGGEQKYYLSGNVMPGHFGPDEVEKSYNLDGHNNRTVPKSEFLSSEPFYPSYVETQTAEEAYVDVMSNVGCNVPMLDDTDKRIIKGVLDSTTSYVGSKTGFPGIPDHENDVGGYEEYQEVKRPDNWDTDHDGMPDEWEKKKGLNPSDKTDGNNTNLSDEGYTNLEMYLNELAGDFKVKTALQPQPDANSFAKWGADYSYNSIKRTLHIQSTSTRRLKVDILSLKGEIVLSRELTPRNGEITLSLEGLRAGLYLLRFHANNRVQIGKINRL
ncbi:MAG: hypothetical protein PVI26_01745 [Chitinispirillia bacterium]|jgi:hypothetical protein